MPLVGSTSPCGEVGHERPTVRSNGSCPEHHFRDLPMTRLVKVMGHFRPLFPGPQQLICHWFAGKRCLLPTSAADLCCHEHPLDPQLPSLRLTPFRPPRPASCPLPRLHAADDIRPSTPMPDSRCRHLRPWVATQLTLRPPAAAAFTVPEGCPVARALAAVSFLGRPATRFGDHKRPLSQPWLRLVAQPAPREPGPASLTPHQERELPRSRAPSTGRSRRASPVACAPSAALRAATGFLALPPRPSFRHAFTHNLAR